MIHRSNCEKETTKVKASVVFPVVGELVPPLQSGDPIFLSNEAVGPAGWLGKTWPFRCIDILDFRQIQGPNPERPILNWLTSNSGRARFGPVSAFDSAPSGAAFPV